MNVNDPRQQFPGPNMAPLRGTGNLPMPPRPGPYEGTGAAPNAAFLGSRASMQGGAPMADLQFGGPMSPQMQQYMNAMPDAQAMAAMRERAFHNDQPLNQMRRDIGERASDPWGQAQMQWGSRMLQQPQGSPGQQIIDLMSGAGQSI